MSFLATLEGGAVFVFTNARCYAFMRKTRWHSSNRGTVL